jgi:hypothetical protein
MDVTHGDAAGATRANADADAAHGNRSVTHTTRGRVIAPSGRGDVKAGGAPGGAP